MDVFDCLFYLLPFLLYAAYRRFVDSYWRSLFWIWDNGSDESSGNPRISIDTNDISFPPNFIWGVATSAHQVEGGCTNCQWHLWESAVDEGGRPRIKRGQKAGKAADHWNRYVDDIRLCKSLGVNGFKLSLEWSKIEPNEGDISAEAIQHYHSVIDTMLSHHIQPIITLHHFTHPIWFDRMGAFERKENIQKFISFCKLLFNEYSHKVRMWCTFNEPFFFVFGGWMNGNFPPGKRDNTLAGQVLVNLLEAHVEVYSALKELPNGSQCSIGITKDIYQFDAWNPINPLDVGSAKFLNYLFNDSILEFFMNGTLIFRPIGVAPIHYHNPKAITSNDFIGLNYYSHSFVKIKPSLPNPVELCLPHQGVIMTDQNNAAIYPEGLYRALMQLSIMKLPIYVTENGIADANDDRRHLFLRRYIYAMSKAISDGANVKGYFYWSLLDSFEWDEGFDLKFGFFKVDFATQTRTLRDGAKYYSAVIRKFRGRRKESDMMGGREGEGKGKDEAGALTIPTVSEMDDNEEDSEKSATSQSFSSSSSSLVHRSSSILATINNNYYIVPNDNAVKSFASTEGKEKEKEPYTDSDTVINSSITDMLGDDKKNQ